MARRGQRFSLRHYAAVFGGVVCLSPFTLFFSPIHALGGELANFDTPPFTADITHRQNFCERYIQVAQSNRTLKDALNGVQLRPVLQYGPGFPYFNYDPVTGIDPDEPGLVAKMLDYIGAPERANFTWRDSFAVYSAEDKGDVKTWTDMLQWATDTYDLSVDKWAQSTERLDLGIAFCDSWFDASAIMIEKIEVQEPDINYGNWLRPFDSTVWWVTLATILFSALVYQFLEFMAGERDDRTFRKWFMDNLYLSTINFTQNYPYEPVSLAAKLFGISFAMWTMLIGATYTANLASLLVEAQGGYGEVQSIDEAVTRQLTICTHAKAASDLYLKNNYRNAIRREKPGVLPAYDGLNSGECDLLVDTQQGWDSFQFIEEYNPTCQLKRVGRTVKVRDAGFATKVDPGFRCTGLVNEVINYWLSEMNDEGYLTELWDEFNAGAATPNFDCSAGASSGRRRLGSSQKKKNNKNHYVNHKYDNNNNNIALSNHNAHSASQHSNNDRKLKGAAKGGAAGGGAAATEAASAGGDDGGGGEENSLTIEQMAGVFLMHLIGTIIAVIVAIISRFEKKHNVKRHGSKKLNNNEQDVVGVSKTARTADEGELSSSDHNSTKSNGRQEETAPPSSSDTTVTREQYERLEAQLATVLTKLNNISELLLTDEDTLDGYKKDN